MAIIRGNFKYVSYYQSLDELIDDEYVEKDRKVIVKTGAQEVSYFITDIRGENSYPLKNGLYAVETLIGNSSSSDSKKQYVRDSGTDTSVGFLKEGTIPRYTDTNYLLDAIFYDGFTIFDISTNLNEEIHVKGERHTITSVILDIGRCDEVINEIEVRVGSITKTEQGRYGSGDRITINISATVYDDADIEVYCRSVNNEKKQVKHLYFSNPIYYGMINAGIVPGAGAIKRMSRVMKPGVISDTQTLQKTEFFLAVPSTYKLKKIYDENGIPETSEFTSYTISITHDQDTTNYICYYSKSLIIDDYTMNYELEKI